ncbi:MAG: cytidylate kinase-like family protein [Bacteroidaceae bacterium]|nr:cytidylate kinase-like family protein [Bacteroidaceae bacterium]
MDKFVITINRQFGSGGHEVGDLLAKRLGVKIIDKEVAQAIAQKFEMTQEEFDKIDYRKPSWWEEFTMFYSPFAAMGSQRTTVDKAVTSRQMYLEQTALLKKLAEEESCIVIGRCAFHIFKDHPHCVRIFVHGSEERRLKHAMEYFKVDEEETRRMMEDTDKKRYDYIKKYTGTSGFDLRNYDFCFNADVLSIEEMADIVYNYITREKA